MPERARKKRRREERVIPPPKQPVSPFWLYLTAVAAGLIVLFVVYRPALHGPFVFDDATQPYDTPNFSTSLRAWISGVRPLLMASYWMNYTDSTAPFGFHVTNVLIHFLNGWLIFAIVRKMQQIATPAIASGTRTLLAAFAAAVFLLHPIQTESVAYIAGRSESLSVFFFLAAFAVFIYRRSTVVSWRVAIVVQLLAAAAFLSKEHTAVLPALLLLTDYYWNPGFSFSGIRKNWRIYIPIAVAAVGGLLFILRILSFAGFSAGFGLKDFTWYQYFFTECRAFFVYLRLMIIPFGQSLDWDFSISHTIVEHGAIFGLVAILLLIAVALYFRKRFPLASYGFLVYVLLMAPTSSFVPIRDPIAERRLYLPMIGLLLIVTAVLQHVRIERRKLATSLGVVTLVLLLITFQRNQVWASDVTLWEDTARESPGKSRVHFQLARIYFDHHRWSDAEKEFAAIARIEKPDYGVLVDWGLALSHMDQLDAALAKLREAAAQNPTAHVYSEIGKVYGEHSMWREAVESLAHAESINPNYDMIYDNLGVIHTKMNDLPAAAADFQHALQVNPSNEHARNALNVVQQQLAAPR